MPVLPDGGYHQHTGADVAAGLVPGFGGAAGVASGPTGTTDNLPLDSRWHGGSPYTPPLFRGMITRDDNRNRRVYFLFNPNTISIAFGANQDQLNSANIDVNAAGETLSDSLVTWGFTLLFDRHFEVAYGGDKLGVMRDVLAFEQLLGFLEVNMGVMDWVPLWWFLGNSVYMQFFGRMSGFNAELTLFSKDMIPMQAEVQVQGEGMFGGTQRSFPGSPTSNGANNGTGAAGGPPGSPPPAQVSAPAPSSVGRRIFFQ